MQGLKGSPYDSYIHLDLEQAVFHVVILFLAYIITLPIGLERSRFKKGPGLRTLSIVSMACCAYVLVAFSVFSEAHAQSKLLYGVITGVGFIGGGALFKSDDGVYGTASAASLWVACAIGISVGLAMLEIAIVLSLTTTGTLIFGSRPRNDSDPQVSAD